MRISYWSSDVCSSDLQRRLRLFQILIEQDRVIEARHRIAGRHLQPLLVGESGALIVAGLAIEDAKPVERDHIVRIDLRGARERTDRRIALLGLGVEDAEIGPRTGVLRNVLGQLGERDRKSTRLNSSNSCATRMPYSA